MALAACRAGGLHAIAVADGCPTQAMPLSGRVVDGAGVLSDAETQMIMDLDLVPAFYARAYAKGLNDGPTGIEREIETIR